MGYGNDDTTKLLIHASGDTGITGLDATVNGAPVVRSFKAEGNKIVNQSIFFDGAGAWVECADSPDFPDGSGAFTIEFNFNTNVPVRTDGTYIYAHGTSTASITDWLWIALRKSGTGEDGQLQCSYRQANTNRVQLITGVSLAELEWGHFAFTFDGTDTFRLYKNGVQVDSDNTYTPVTLVLGSPMRIGAQSNIVTPPGAVELLLGHVAGYAVHNAELYPDGTSFTPPASISEMTNDANTVLFLDFAELAQGDTPATLVDSSASARTVTNSGTKVSGCTWWWYAALETDGASDWLSVSDHASLTKGSGDFVVHGYIMAPNDSTLYRVMGQADSTPSNASNALFVIIDADNTIRGGYSDGSSIYEADTADTLNDGINHFALVKSGNELAMHLNGTKGAGTDDVTGVTSTDSSSDLSIGRQGEYASDLFPGLIGEVEIIIGSDNGWGTSVVPPTHRSLGGANTKFLYSPYGNDALGSSVNHNMTLSDGMVLAEESDVGFTDGSYKFNGSSNSVTIPSSTDFDFT